MAKAFQIVLFAAFAWIALPESVSGEAPAFAVEETGGSAAEQQSPGSQPAQAAVLDSLDAVTDSLARAADSLKALVDSLSSVAGAGAQAPSQEKAPAVEAEKGPWQGSFGFGLTMNRGNSRQSALISNLEISRTGEKTRLIHQTTVTRTTSEDKGDASKGSFNSKYELNQSRRFFSFTALDMDYNRRAGIDFRAAPGLGIGISAVANKRCRLSFNFGANIVTEYLREMPNRTNGHYLGSQDLRITLNSRTRLDQSLTYKPRFDRTEEYLLDFSVSLTSNLTSSFDLKINFESNYNSRPPVDDPPIRRHDWMLYTAVTYSIW